MREPREGAGGRGERGGRGSDARAEGTSTEPHRDAVPGEPRHDGRNGAGNRLAPDAESGEGRAAEATGASSPFVDTLPNGPAVEGGEGSGERQGGRRRNRRGGRGRDRDRDDTRAGERGEVANGADASAESSHAGPGTEAGERAPGAARAEGARDEGADRGDRAREPEGTPAERSVGEDGEAREGGRRRGRGRGRGPREGERAGFEASPADSGGESMSSTPDAASQLGDHDRAAAEDGNGPRDAAPMHAMSQTRSSDEDRDAARPAESERHPSMSAPAPALAPRAFASAPATPAAAPSPVPETAYALPMDSLVAVAESAGLEWVNSDAHKVEAAQAALAATATPIHVPREIPPVAPLDEGPLVLVETKKDLSQIKLPFETTPRETQGL